MYEAKLYKVSEGELCLHVAYLYRGYEILFDTITTRRIMPHQERDFEYTMHLSLGAWLAGWLPICLYG